MPNFPTETGMENAPWERIRKAMCEINKQRHIIREANRRMEESTTEICYVLWPRTDPDRDKQSNTDDS